MIMKDRLGSCPLVAFVGVTDPARAKEFYGTVLGLTLVEQQLPFALVFNANGTMLRVSIVKEVFPVQHTVLGWDVPDILEAVKELREAGAKFEHYGMAHQDENGIWTSPSGARVAWFKDPDGNILSITQFK